MNLAGLLHGRNAQKTPRKAGSNGLLCDLLCSNQSRNRAANLAMTSFDSLILSPTYA